MYMSHQISMKVEEADLSSFLDVDEPESLSVYLPRCLCVHVGH